MVDPWLSILEKLPLSKTEREVAKRYERDPGGRVFLPVADILRAHRLYDECLELLTQGVDRHPNFTVARVVLARELMQKGMVAEAWQTLENSPVPLRENLLAQKLRFKLALIMGMEEVVKATYHHLSLHQMLDAETKRLGDMVEISGLEEAREQLLTELRDKGIEPVIPDTPPGGPSGAAPSTAATSGGESGDAGPSGAASASFDPDEEEGEEDRSSAGFHVVALGEIFRPDEHAERGASSQGVELDSTTLADIYARQGHYSKALAVYRRLLRMTPHNDYLRRKVAEMTKLDREQKDHDVEVDPSLVDRMETVEILDRQIKFYNELLGKLS